MIVLKALLDSTSKACASREENDSLCSLTEAWQAHHLKVLKCVALYIAPATSFLIKSLMKGIFEYRLDHSLVICYSGRRAEVLNKWTLISISLSPDDVCCLL